MSIDSGAANSWVFIGPLVISFNQPGQLDPARWEQFVEEIKQRPITHCLGTGIGAIEVNSVQRRQAASALRDKKVAVVSDHVVSRGIVTALGWLGLDIKSFDWSHVEDAATFLDVPTLTNEQIVNAALDLRERGTSPANR